jgi:2'-5' RNA ligase
MSRHHKHRKPQPTLDRSFTPIVFPGGATMYVPANQLQTVLGQTFYGSKAGFPTGATPLFSPGQPLPPQPGVDPGGIPVRYPFPQAINTYPPDRSNGNPDIPSFQQLRMLAKMYSGITLCERTWFDLVPRMRAKITLKPEYVAQGYEEKDFQKEISYFKRWFEKPDGKHTADDGSAIGGKDTHTWLRKALREQTQIDELYIYKHRTRGGQLLGLHIIAGDSMKPILNDWGDTPVPDDENPWAFQQYPWGLPGMLYTTDMMLHYQESPAADTPYGQSRVERIIMEVNQALRKKKRDLALFTEGNMPKAIGEVPDTTNWTPDQIDSFEQQWNALMAGNTARQVQMKFTMPGMKVIQIDNGQIMTDFDLWLLNIATGCYGMSMGDLSFTGDIHKSSGDSQQNVLYRRTIGPIAMIYAMMLTDCMNHDFPDELHGELFDLTFGGFEEVEDEQAKASTLTMYTSAGILGLSNAAKLAKLPEEPGGKHLGRMLQTKDGPVWLDDDELMAAQKQAQLAGFQMATQHPQQRVATNSTGDEDDEDSKLPQSKANPKSGKQTGPSARLGAATSASGTQAGTSQGTGKAQNRAVGTEAHTDAVSIWRKGTCTCDECVANDGHVRVAGELFPSGASKPGGHDGCDCKLEPVAFDRAAQQRGMMIAFMLDTKTAQKLALPDGEPAEDLHVTLAFLGDSTDFKGDIAALKSALAAFASASVPLEGYTGGIGRFTPSESSDGMSPVIVLVNVTGLQAWRAGLVHLLETIGVKPANDFDYTPHITLAYVDEDDPLPVEQAPRVPLKFDTLCLAIGDEHFLFPMRGKDELARADIKRWRTRALDDVKAARPFRPFASEVIPPGERRIIEQGLATASTSEEVRAVFERAREGDTRFFVPASANGGSPQQSKSDWKPKW